MAGRGKYIPIFACVSGLAIGYVTLHELFSNWINPSLKCGTNWFGFLLGLFGLILGEILILFGTNKLLDKRIARIIGGFALIIAASLLILFILYPGCQIAHAR